ncbi:MAG TPA: VOC family protein [Thermoanaerobaculia bacterium]|nr:VOC family protein [Thermoanaerobaculia bacterium]
MSEQQPPEIGTFGWADLTVPNAEEVRDFYQAVAGWKAQGLDMGGYSDFIMSAPGGRPVSGVCHARGPNVGIPPQWLIYITVEDLDHSVAQCTERGGKVIVGPKDAGGGARYCVIQDPAGASAALYQAGPPK